LCTVGAGHGWDSFGRAFDDMGGLMLNLANLSNLTHLLGMDMEIANAMLSGFAAVDRHLL